jgi:V/A-type H+/Na+-transporting ATPase subunit D
MKFQYNKTALQEINKQLKSRQRALPTIKNKESALRLEVQKAKDYLHQLDEELETRILQYDYMVRIWGEFDSSLLSVTDVKLSVKKTAGVRIPQMDEVVFEIKDFSLFNQPQWFLQGISILKGLTEKGIEREFFYNKMQVLSHARKKTTQKVNLYEKVQIPGYQDAIRKIKRFLEDEENLSKSSQKIVKKRQQETEEAA